MKNTRQFYRLFFHVQHLLLHAAASSAVFMILYVRIMTENPADAFRCGMTVQQIPVMAEYILVSTILLIGGGIAAEWILREY